MSTSCIYGPRLFYVRPFRENDAVEAVIKVRDWSHLTAPMSALRLNIHKIGQDTNTFKFYDSRVEIKLGENLTAAQGKNEIATHRKWLKINFCLP